MPSAHVYNDVDPLEDVSHQIISSYFLGPKSENHEWFKARLIDILDSVKDARLNYYPRDGKFITQDVQESTAFRKSANRMSNAVRQVILLLGTHSVPFWSPRYQGHMCMDMSMPALLGYFMTMLYNPNNVTIEASPITTIAEMETGDDLCEMFGYNTDPKSNLPVGWGHVTCDGTVANLESMWVARNLKFYPLAIRSAMKKGGPLRFIHKKFMIQTCTLPKPELLENLSTWDMLNILSTDILDIPKRLYEEFYISPKFLESVLESYGIQSVGKSTLEQEFGVPDMRYYVCNTKHYSWPKSGAITGIGSKNIVGLEADHGARLDIEDLRRELEYCLNEHIPIYAVVAIMGTTEEGAVDPLKDIIYLRDEYQKKGLTFLVHCDGAWGGYFCTMLPRGYKLGQDIALPHEQLPSNQGSLDGFVPDSGLRSRTSEDLFMIRMADSVTVDPHKAAYIPYPAGGLCYRDGRMRYLVTWTSPYISRGETTDTTIGVYGVEGSKPGASVMSTWFANRCIGLNPEGYGALLGEVTFTCSRLAAQWAAMSVEEDDFVCVPLNELPAELASDTSQGKVDAQRQFIRDNILGKSNAQIVTEDNDRPEEEGALRLMRELGSDLNINAFALNWKDAYHNLNKDVEEANYFNQLVIRDLSVDSPEDDPTTIPFFLTSTTFKIHEYGKCAQNFKRRLGLDQDMTDVVSLRNVVMSPWPTDGNFINRLVDEFRKTINKHVKTCRERNDVSPTKHDFLLQGTDKTFAVHYPRFHLEKHRRQFILEVELDSDTKNKYLGEQGKLSDEFLVLKTTEDVTLDQLAGDKREIKAALGKRQETAQVNKDGQMDPPDQIIIENITVKISKVLKNKSLKAKFRDQAYPSDTVPFYLYGTEQSLNIDHIVVRSPNISLSAENVTFKPDDGFGQVDATELEKGAIVVIDYLNEAAMQPFQSTEGDMKDTLNSNSDFFFTEGRAFQVRVFADPTEVNENGPGLVPNIPREEDDTENGKNGTNGTSHQAKGITAATQAALKSASRGHDANGTPNEPPPRDFKLLSQGTLTLGKGRYVDSVQINKDPYFIPEGTDKFNAWKALFDSVGLLPSK